MANITSNPNFTYIDNFMYTIDESLQMLLKVTFDSSIAFSYPLDVAISNEVVALSYDGYGFWSFEYSTNRVIMRRWLIDNMMCKQMNKFEVVGSASEIIDASSFGVESYEVKFTGDEPSGQTVLSIDDGSHMSPGDRLLLGPNSAGQSEYVIVDEAFATSVTTTTATLYGYAIDDKIRFYKYGYFINNAFNDDTSLGCLYKIDLYSGSVIAKHSGTQYKDVTSCHVCTIVDSRGDPVLDYNGDSVYDLFKALIFVKGNLLFIADIYDTSFRVITSMILDINQTDTIHDITSRESIVYLLEDGYEYTVAQFDIVPMSLSLSGYPAILPADGISTSVITATVLDQYNRPIPNKIVTFQGSGGSLSTSSAITDANGVATVIFTAPDHVGTTTISAEVRR